MPEPHLLLRTLLLVVCSSSDLYIYINVSLVLGMMQRLDRMRKHSFGSMCLFGENDDSTISGVWIWRGQNLAFEVSWWNHSLSHPHLL